MLFTQFKLLNTVSSTQKRNLWRWVNMMFNKVDEERRKEFGPDRTCAEWILRNGGRVKFRQETKYLENYNNLPLEGIKQYIEEVDATDSAIMHYGFDHFRGCKYIIKVILHNCSYIENEALENLSNLRDTLKFLQVSKCHNISDKGLLSLGGLKNLSTLVLFDLPYVKNKDSVMTNLKQNLPNCNIDYK